MTESVREDRKTRKYKRYTAFSIIVLCLYIFFLCTNGFIAGLTIGYKSLLYDWLGKTNKWSGSYGSESLVEVMRSFALLASPFFVSFFSVILGGYIFIRKKYRTLYTYFFVVIGAGFFHVFLKNYYAGEPWYNWLNLFDIEGKDFPSGHAFMSVVLYFTLARLIYRANPEIKLKQYVMTIALLLDIAIGISLLVLGAHSPNEIIAGWAIGFAWISGAWILDHSIRKRIYMRNHLKDADLTRT
jgi:membrane-associated phospholipid phosphatase